MTIKRIIGDSLEANTILQTKIADSTISSNKLSPTGVVATTYGNATNIPVITIDAAGRITAASNVVVVGGVSSVAGASGAVSNVQIAAGISSTTVSNLTITGNVSLGTNSPSANVHVANGAVSSAFFLSPVTIDNDYNIPTNYNAMTAGPVTIASSANVTIPDGSTWTVV